MARTKQTAKLSTGAPAPRQDLSRMVSPHQAPAENSTKQRKVTTVSSSRAPADAKKVETKKNQVRTRKANHQVPEKLGGPEKDIVDIIDRVIQSIPKVNIITLRVDAEPLSAPNGETPWCNGCRNGGLLLMCTVCNIRGFCSACVVHPEINSLNETQAGFLCPPCHLFRTKGLRNPRPYPHKFIGVASTRELWPSVSAESVAVMSIRLQGISPMLNPAFTVYTHLHQYLLGNVFYTDLDFFFDPEDPEIGTSYRRRLTELLDELETGRFKSCKRFLVFFTDHSSPDTGDLHIVPDNQGASTVKELFGIIFQDRFPAILGRSTDSVMVLLSCGGIVGQPESLSHLKEFSQSGLFSKIIAFSQTNFQIAFSTKFLMDYALNFFVFGKDNLLASLNDQQVLGAHSDVILIEKSAVRRLIWAHHGSRPFGKSPPLQCPSCSCLSHWSPTVEEKTITLVCRVCQHSIPFYLPDDLTWVKKPVKGDERGGWLVKVL
ncbi:hypothetical protein BDZ97DRAFT_1934474 [Flammula alnicola]|nr:hypothetical protein BDZ97DRAFT_1934474 [Flammula alnicola]